MKKQSLWGVPRRLCFFIVAVASVIICMPAYCEKHNESSGLSRDFPGIKTEGAAQEAGLVAGADTSLPLYITADTLSYLEGAGEIRAKENVILRHDDAVIFADEIHINTKTGDVYARGNVLAIQNASRIYTDSLEYNTNSKIAKCVNADISSPPWRGTCALIEGSEKKHSLTDAVITTCDMEKPHYRIAASAINFYVNDRVEIFNAVVYIGAIPVLYWPYYTQPINADRPPFDIKPGHNDNDGWYLYLTYNHFFDAQNRLSLGYDYMERRGNRGRLDYNYALGKDARGYLKGFYQYDKIKDAAGEAPHRWEFSAEHNQQFDANNRAGLSIYSFSDVGLGRDIVTEIKDVFRQKYDAYYNTAINGHAISLSVSNTEEINTSTAKYETKARTLPNFSYSMPSLNILPNIYYNHGFSFVRNYTADTSALGYRQSGVFSPRLTMGGVRFLNMSFSANAGLNTAYSDYEGDDSDSKFINTLNTSESLSFDIVPGGLLRGSASHSFAQRLNYRVGGGDGITTNSLNMNISASVFGLNMNMGTTYNMLAGAAGLPSSSSDLNRFSPLVMSGAFGAGSYYFSANSNYSIIANRVKNLSFSLRFEDPAPVKLWSVAATTNYINNTIDFAGRPQLAQKDSIRFATSVRVPAGRDFDLFFSREYDLTEKYVTTQSYTVAWRVHCWSVNFSWVKRHDGAETVNFSLFIRDIPGARFDKPVTAIPNYQEMLGI